MSAKRPWSIGNKLAAGSLLVAILTLTLHFEKPVLTVSTDPTKPAEQLETKPQPPRQQAKSRTVGKKDVAGNNVAGDGNAVGNNNQANSSTSGPAIGSIAQGPSSIVQIGAGNQETAGIKPPEELFTADIMVSILGEGFFWAVVDGHFVSPVDALLVLRIVDTQGKLASLSSISVELRTEDGHWVQLRRIPERDFILYAGPMENSRHITITPADVVDVLASKGTLNPADPVVGTMLLISHEETFHVPKGDPTFRITLQDTQHRWTVIKTTTHGHQPDPSGFIGASLFIHPTQDMANLTRLPVYRFSSQE